MNWGGELRCVNLGAGQKNGDCGSRDGEEGIDWISLLRKRRKGRATASSGTCVFEILAFNLAGALPNLQAICVFRCYFHHWHLKV